MSTSPTRQQLQSWLEAAEAIAREAGELILDFYEGEVKIKIKGDHTPVTEADLAAHELIVSRLWVLTPGVPILSEESGAVPFSTRQQWPLYWLVDPLDGTREFIDHNGEFTVNIALIAGNQPILGVVYAPVLDLMYYAALGLGAFKQHTHLPAQQIHARTVPQAPIVVAGSRSHRGDSLQRFLQNIGEHELLGLGSALKSCLVAEGLVDVYPRLGPTSEWDTAAAQCVVEEAGGMITDTLMQPLRYNTKDSLLNPHFLVFGDRNVDWSSYL